MWAASAALTGCATTTTDFASRFPHAGATPVPALKPGGGVAIVAPASTEPSKIDEAARWLSARGFVPRVMPACRDTRPAPFDFLAGTDAARLADVHAAFAAPEINAVWCLRGGFGSGRLLDKIDYALLRANPKPFIGYSDITAMHAAIQRHAGFVTFHGPMLSSDLLVPKLAPTEADVFNMIEGRVTPGMWFAPPPEFALAALAPGVASGRLVGGNLSLQVSLLGTPYEIDTNGAILFIEDVDETPARIDRMLNHLRLAGKLASVKGVLGGNFSGLGEHPEDKVDPTMIYPVLSATFAPLGIPVLAGWPAGHCDPNLTLPLGAQVQLDTTRRALQLEQAVVI